MLSGWLSPGFEEKFGHLDGGCDSCKFLSNWLFYGDLTASSLVGTNTRCIQFQIIPSTTGWQTEQEKPTNCGSRAAEVLANFFSSKL